MLVISACSCTCCWGWHDKVELYLCCGCIYIAAVLYGTCVGPVSMLASCEHELPDSEETGPAFVHSPNSPPAPKCSAKICSPST